MMKKPRGRPRKDCTWDPSHGWVHIGRNTTYAAPQPQHRPAVRPVIATRVQTPQEIERARLREEEAAAAAAEAAAAEAAAKVAAAEAKAVEDAAREAARKQKECLEMPRMYAAQIRVPRGVPVYYFDTFGNFRQLGCEPTPTPKPPPPHAVPKKRRKRRQLRRVVGPSVEYGLDAGESEYVSD